MMIIGHSTGPDDPLTARVNGGWVYLREGAVGAMLRDDDATRAALRDLVRGWDREEEAAARDAVAHAAHAAPDRCRHCGTEGVRHEGGGMLDAAYDDAGHRVLMASATTGDLVCLFCAQAEGVTVTTVPPRCGHCGRRVGPRHWAAGYDWSHLYGDWSCTPGGTVAEVDGTSLVPEALWPTDDEPVEVA